mmetsp:Transcript_10481/g.25321  ORF Transcript_10481/g.25321 Transcript_10481/m.25321 type:complete len:382 (-) Transcript_10481:1886-3031(-)
MTPAPVSDGEDPFTELEQQGYDANHLIWASKTRGSLEQQPPLQLTHDNSDDGIIRVKQVVSKFLQESSGIQVGFQLLQLQGRKVADYQGGFEEIQKVIQESLCLELVVLKSPGDDDGSSVEASETGTNKENRTSIIIHRRDSQKRHKRMSSIHDPGNNGWVKISPIPPKEEEKQAAKNFFAAIPDRYRHDNLLWACNNRYSARQPIPLHLIQDDNDNGAIIRIQQIDPQFQKDTGLQVGQRVVQLQEKDIASYQDFQEIQDIVQESLKLNLVVIRSSCEAVNTEKSSPKSTTAKRRYTTTDMSSFINKSAITMTEEESVCTATDITETEDSSQPASDLSLVEEPSPVMEEKLVVVEEPLPSKPKRGWFKSKLFRKRVSAPA